jgi:tRNA pseudouridine38-40 synthase
MPRYFLELSYKGTNYSGFQSQKNTDKTIQAEVEKAMNTLLPPPSPLSSGEGQEIRRVRLTPSSRTDAAVHALQNFFHFDLDSDSLLHLWRRVGDEVQFVYKMNAILPDDIVVKRLIPVKDDAHCRFDAIGRMYKYYIYRHKDPFLKDRAFYFPYKLDIDKLNLAAAVIKEYDDFTSFSKRNTQVKTFFCQVAESKWVWENGCLVYHVEGNRFLRGMVRALTATMLKVGRGKISIDDFRNIILAKDCTKASFSVPSHGLFLVSVQFPADYFQ